ncbi:hypothetical protein GE09DRAFT_1063397 [Coniochaeta sp. 2T2.1]|nr:hypothetical protein GE09DRAFT_1063397 [Coniochaeta sp. 2T2.1]
MGRFAAGHTATRLARFNETDLSKYENPELRKVDSPTPCLTAADTSRVALLVNKEIPEADVAFERYQGAPDLGSCVTIETPNFGPLKIYNFYNHCQELDIKALAETCGGPNQMVMADLNSHDPLWGGATVRRGDASGNALANWSADKSMTCLNKPGQVTYSRSADDTTNSTIDLTFLGSSLHPLLIDWDIVDVEGFESDHRVIQSTLATSCNAVTKFHRLWKQVDQPKFKRKLARALGRLGMPPLRTKSDIDNLIDTVVPVYQTTLEESGHGRRIERLIAKLEPTIRKKIEEDPDSRTNPEHPLRKLDPFEIAKVLTDRIRRCPRGKGSKNGTMDHRPDAARPSLESEPKLREGEVAKILANLPTNKAFGPDAVPNEAFKVTRKASLPILEHIFEAYIRLRHHPSQRITKLMAIHKLLPEHQVTRPGGSTEAALEHFKAFVYRAWGPSYIRPKTTREGFTRLVVTIIASETYETNCKALEKLHGVLMKWAGDNGLVFGADKYRVMHLEAPWIPAVKDCQRDGYEANGCCILRPDIDGLGPKAVQDEDAPYMKILGVHFHYKMDWKITSTRSEKRPRRSSISYAPLAVFTGALACTICVSSQTWSIDSRRCKRLA